MERHHHRIALALIVTLGLGFASVASAQDDEAPEPDPEVAQRLFDAGVEHLEQQRFEEAADDFRRSYRATPRVEAMCNLALTYDRWGEHQDLALRAYRTCARDDESGRFRQYAEGRVGEIERELALAAATDPDVAHPDEHGPHDSDDFPPPPPRPEVDHTVLYVGLAVGGLALVALGVGIGHALHSQSIVDGLIDELGPMPTLVRGSPEHQRYEDALLFADIATAMYVLMGSMLAASGAMIIVDLAVSGASNEPTMALVPTGPGAALVGTF